MLFLLISLSLGARGQVVENRLTQTIRGTITDAASGETIPFATVNLPEMPERVAVSDSAGRFVLPGVPVGRHTVRASYLGYEPTVIKEIMVSSAKETYLELVMSESVRLLDEVVVRPQVNKEQPLNKMAAVGARMFSVEEAARYAGGFDDPARLASSFSGVSSGGSTNGISIHGNAPHLLLWRLENIEIPNPNHFADISVLGGGIFSSLSALVLDNSDFLTGAFPAEYGNAVSGVFDMKLRNGNNQAYEHTAQIGVTGIDVASEGPLNRGNGSSYIVNYRYSMTGLISRLGLMDMQEQKMNYQDLNFKMNFPTRRAGTFAVWGTGLIDKFATRQKDKADWEYNSDRTYSASTQYMGAAGIGHRYFFHGGGRLETTLAGTFFNEHAYVDSYSNQEIPFPYLDMRKKFTNLVVSTSYTRKFSARFTHKTGFTYTRMFYRMNMELAPCYGQPMQPVYNGVGNTGLLTAFTSNAWSMSDVLTLSLGVNGQWLALSGARAVEPRLGLRWRPAARSTFAVGYGLHSRAEKTDVYFVKAGGRYVNSHLGFTKAHHFLLSYVWKLSENTHLKIEPYYQALFNVPVENGTSYSVLNRNDFYLDKALVNKGKGLNYGVDITLERYLLRGWYAMFTGSLFESRYRGGDGVWHDLRYNRKFILNALGGKEWMLGRGRHDVLSVNVKCTVQGGDRYSPIDLAMTLAHPDHEVQYDETRAYSQQYDPMFVLHYTVGYKLNRKKVAHEFAIKHINVTGTKNYYGHLYNEKTGEIDKNGFALSLPNISYKLEF